MSILLFLVVLVALIVVHEFGHLVAAKLFKMRVDEFGIGYPPRAATMFRKGGTDYTLNWLPFGGFVKIHGEDGEAGAPTPDSFVAKPRWQQATVLVAGIAMNIVFAWLFYLLMLLPTLTNITRGRNELLDVIFASDRYAYIPIIALLLLVGLFFAFLRDRWRHIADGGLALLLCALAVAAYAQSLTWKDSRSLFTQVLAVYPDSYVAHTNIGTELYKEGDVSGAMGEYEKAVSIRPDGTTYYNIGQIHLAYGRKTDAIAAFRKSIEASQKDPDPFTYLGVLLLEQGNSVEAQSLLTQAYALKSTMPHTSYYLGVLALEQGRREEAITYFNESLALGMDPAEVQPKLQVLGVGD